jgi:hypothetical protein
LLRIVWGQAVIPFALRPGPVRPRMGGLAPFGRLAITPRRARACLVGHGDKWQTDRSTADSPDLSRAVRAGRARGQGVSSPGSARPDCRTIHSTSPQRGSTFACSTAIARAIFAKHRIPPTQGTVWQLVGVMFIVPATLRSLPGMPRAASPPIVPPAVPECGLDHGGICGGSGKGRIRKDDPTHQRHDKKSSGIIPTKSWRTVRLNFSRRNGPYNAAHRLGWVRLRWQFML